MAPSIHRCPTLPLALVIIATFIIVYQSFGFATLFEIAGTTQSSVLGEGKAQCKFNRKYRGGFSPHDIMGRQHEAGFPLAVEVGAYDGEDAKGMADTGLRVISFEPSKKNYERCVRNYPRADNPHILFVNAAASATSGELSFFDDGGTGACVGCSTGREKEEAKVTVRTVALEAAPELDGMLGDVGYMKIDTQGHEPHVIAGMRGWLLSEEAPPFVQFEFDPCLMRSAGSGKHDALTMLQTLADAGYDLRDGAVSQFEIRFYAHQSLVDDGTLPASLALDAALAENSATRDLVLKRAEALSNERPTDCGDLIDWYCPPSRPTDTWRTYTDVVAVKVRTHASRSQTEGKGGGAAAPSSSGGWLRRRGLV